MFTVVALSYALQNEGFYSQHTVEVHKNYLLTFERKIRDFSCTVAVSDRKITFYSDIHERNSLIRVVRIYVQFGPAVFPEIADTFMDELQQECDNILKSLDFKD